MIAFFSDVNASAGFQVYVIVVYFEYCAVKCPIISFVVIIRIIRNVIVVGYVLVSEDIMVRLFQYIIRIVIAIVVVFLLYVILLFLG